MKQECPTNLERRTKEIYNSPVSIPKHFDPGGHLGVTTGSDLHPDQDPTLTP